MSGRLREVHTLTRLYSCRGTECEWSTPTPHATPTVAPLPLPAWSCLERGGGYKLGEAGGYPLYPELIPPAPPGAAKAQTKRKGLNYYGFN